MTDRDNEYRQTMNQISALMNLMRPMINQIGRQTDDMGRFDSEFIKIGRNFHDLRQDMITLQSGQAEIRSELSALGSNVSSVKLELSDFRSSVTSRLDGIFVRLDEIENTGLQTDQSIRNLTSEMLLQHNTILNALQDSHNNKLALKEIDERLSELERQVRQLRSN